ncbi:MULTISPECIES: GcrA family cell cycle regulator [unclassified Bradyrhizobium]|uniref:GcrA family cell cycle regulator n=1 Tax=unclassified Bradyrhizobium TaxID=2631580 RepID=UPI002FEE8F11
MELSNWAPEHSDALREFVAKGLSYSEAAQAINSRFNTSYSRSAALGRARRLGLTADDRRKPSMPTEPAELREIGEARVSAFSASALPWPTAPVFKEIRPVKLRCAAIEPRHLSLIELERGDCRYPYGGDQESEAITFCGHPRRPSSSYCTPHFHLSRNPVEMADCPASTGGGDGMKNVAVACVADMLKRLPRRHRIAHLRALIGLQPDGCDCRDELSELLRDEMSGASIE